MGYDNNKLETSPNLQILKLHNTMNEQHLCLKQRKAKNKNSVPLWFLLSFLTANIPNLMDEKHNLQHFTMIYVGCSLIPENAHYPSLELTINFKTTVTMLK